MDKPYSEGPDMLREDAQKLMFCMKLGGYLGRNDTVWTMCVVCILSKALLTILIYPRKFIRHLSSNGCHSLYHILVLPLQREHLKYDILHHIVYLLLVVMTQCGP